MEEPERYFTLLEAQALVPWLQATFDAIEPLKQQLAKVKERMQSHVTRMQSNGGAKAQQGLKEDTVALREAQDRVEELANAIVERGMILRSLERSLLDFPSIRDGREVHLCWLNGEPEITHWHEVGAGFAERQRL